MVELKVKDGKIETKMVQDSSCPIYEELGNGTAQLLVDFQVELLWRSNSSEKVQVAFCEIMAAVMSQNDERVSRERGR